MSDGLLESGGEDGLGVKIFADVDEASFQRANRSTKEVEKNLLNISKINFSPVSSSIKAIAAGMAGLGVMTVKVNQDEVQNVLKAVKAGINNEDFKRWTSVEMQLGLGKGSITKDLASIYEQMNRIKALGDLNKDQFLALGLLGVNADKFINEGNNTSRIKMVMDAALKSGRNPGEAAALTDQALGAGMGDLYRMLQFSGIPLDSLLGKMTMFTDSGTQSSSMAFNSEYQVMISNIQEMSRLLSSTFGEKLTPFLKDFNSWVDKYQGILDRILRLQGGWLDDLFAIASGRIVDPTNKFGSLSATSEERYALSQGGQSLLKTDKGFRIARDLFRSNKAFTIPQLMAAGIDKGIAWQLSGDYDQQRSMVSNYFEGLKDPANAQKLKDVQNLALIADLYNNVLSNKSLIGKGAYTGGYSSGRDFSGLRRSEINSMRSVDESFDEIIATALMRLRNNPSKFNELMGLITGADTIKGSSIPGLDSSLRDTMFYTEESFNRLMQFLEKSEVFDKTSMAPITVNNELRLSFGSTPSSSEAADIGNKIGAAISSKIRDAMHYSDQAVGALG